MPASDEPLPAQLKDWFNEARHHQLARELAAVAPRFEADVFLQLTLDGLAARSLMQRLQQCAVAAEAALPGTYRQKVGVLKKLAPGSGMSSSRFSWAILSPASGPATLTSPWRPCAFSPAMARPSLPCDPSSPPNRSAPSPP